MPRGVYGVERHIEAQIAGKESDLPFEHRSERLWPVHMKRCRTSQKAKRGNHTNQSEAMVTMQMGDEDMTQFGKTHMTTAQLHLRTLCTIEHEYLLPHLNDLRRGIVPERWECTAAPENMYFKRFQGSVCV
jgi:hypothetical protein